MNTSDALAAMHDAPAFHLQEIDTTLALVRCPFCKLTCAEVLGVEIDMYAGVCRACGAQGPIRVLGPKQLVEHVKAQAARDWNRAAGEQTNSPRLHPALALAGLPKSMGYDVDDQFAYSVINFSHEPPESTKGPAAASPVEGQAHHEKPGESVSTEAPGTLKPTEAHSAPCTAAEEGGPEEDRKPDAVGEAVTHSLSTPGPSTDPAATCTRLPDSPVGQDAKAAPDGGGATAKGISPRQLEVGDRLARFLDDIGMSAQAAWDKGMDFGVHVATLYAILRGQRVSEKSLAAIEKALTRMERGRRLSGAAQEKPKAKPATRVEPSSQVPADRVEVLGNQFREPTGVNRAPAPVAPPRHARTP